MAFKAEYESQEAVPEALRDHYTQHEDGKWRPEVEAANGWSFENVAGLKSALEKNQTEAQTATKELKKAQGELAKSQERITELESSQGDDEKKRQEQIDEIKTRLRTEHEKETEELRTTLQGREAQLQESLIEGAAIRAINDPEIKGKQALLLPLVKSRAKLEPDNDGNLRVVLYKEDGKTQLLNGKAEPASFKDLLAEMRSQPEYGSAFGGDTIPGGDTPASTTPGSDGKLTPEQAGKLSPREYAKAREEGKI